jgi:hypothetical protein
MKITIDRFEENFAVVELPNGETCSVPRELFPDAKEGDIFQISKSEEETATRAEEMRNRFDKLRQGGNSE